MSYYLKRDQLIAEIEKRVPWYQRIEFPEYGITTTDKPEWVFNDCACDQLFPEVDEKKAAQLRPFPKWERLRPLIPELKKKSVLEIGASCGFFIFEICRLGAKYGTGLELDERNVERARFCAKVLRIENAHFIAGDIGDYVSAHDIVLISSVHEHFIFPFYYLTRALCLAGQMLLLDTHHYINDDSENVNRLDLSYSNNGKPGSHAFHFSKKMYADYLSMIGITPTDIQEKIYYDDGTVRRVLMCIDTLHFQRERMSNHYLQPLVSVGA